MYTCRCRLKGLGHSMCGGRAAVGNGNTVDCAGPITGDLMTVDGHDSLDTRASYEGFRRLHEVLQSQRRPLLVSKKLG